jgi:monoamine oxidase
MRAAHLVPLLPLALATAVRRENDETKHAQVIILGGGIAGISLAKSLVKDYNITDIVIIEGRDELGGRAHTESLTNPSTGHVVTVEKGCNWIQGPGKEPIQALAKKWGLQTARQNYSDVTWFEGKGIEANGERGRFLDEDAQAAFMEGYDDFLENAPGYSSGLAYNQRVMADDGSLASKQHACRLVGSRCDFDHGLDSGQSAPKPVRVLEHRLHVCAAARDQQLQQRIRPRSRARERS